MRIAFVGKGGSGKTTLSVLFSQYMRGKFPVVVIDADLNMHVAPLLGFPESIPQESHLSHPKATEVIKTYLRGNNGRIKALSHFRKTTPPTNDSNFIVLHDAKNPLFEQFGLGDASLRLLTVGTYDADEIGASCYHNNLAILENILTHAIDTKGVLVVDMVAGIDAFANTLHAQFDLLMLVVEPTKRGVEVWSQYSALAKEAGVEQNLFVIGNKVYQESDKAFLRAHIPEEKIIGFFGDSLYLRKKDQEGGMLDPRYLEVEQKALLLEIEKRLLTITPEPQSRLKKLYILHRRYVAQASIRERFGDLTDQIDDSFDIRSIIARYA